MTALLPLAEAKLVIGIPTVPRPRPYLFQTIDSILAGIPAEARARVELVVYNAAVPPETHAAARAVRDRYAADVAAGRIVLLENPDGHAALEGLEARCPPGTKPAYFRWRSKLVLDFARLVSFASARGDYYLHVEDDMLAAPELLPRLQAWFDPHFRARDDWAFLTLFAPFSMTDRQAFPLERYYSCCALLFRAADAAAFAATCARRHAEAELDFLARDFAVTTGRQVFVRAPSLFQHVGVLSSFGDERRLIQSPLFEEGIAGALQRNARAARDVLLAHPAELPRFLRWKAEVALRFALRPIVHGARRLLGRSIHREP